MLCALQEDKTKPIKSIEVHMRLDHNLLTSKVRNAGHVLTHATLLAKVWGREYVDEVDYRRVYVRRLRDKLGDDPDRSE